MLELLLDNFLFDLYSVELSFFFALFTIISNAPSFISSYLPIGGVFRFFVELLKTINFILMFAVAYVLYIFGFNIDEVFYVSANWASLVGLQPVLTE